MTDTDVYQRLEHRLRDDLLLGGDDVAGVLEIIREEFDPIVYTLDEWSCDRCGEHKTTATKGGEKVCNPCIFDDPPIQRGGER